MTNYEMLQFLIEDGGYYTAVGHFDVLKSKFPEITENHIKSLRSAIQRSPLVVSKSKFAGGKKAFKVISIDPSYTTNAEGRGPAWANSLFEDNAEFGLGFRLTVDQHRARVLRLLNSLAPQQARNAGLLVRWPTNRGLHDGFKRSD